MELEGELELPTWSALPARANPEFDALARTAADALAVPIALVVLVSKGGQVFPGAVGLTAETDARRSGPLGQSLSRQVARSGHPLVVRDTLAGADLRDHGVVRELGLRSYAGVPLLDVQGRPLGALCAVDHEPRDWSAADLELLGRLADQCSRRLQVHALELAEREAEAATVRSAAAADQAARGAQAAFEAAEAEADRARVVARLAHALLGARSLPDVLRTVDRFVRSPLGAAAAVLGVVEDGSDLLRAWTTGPGPFAERAVVLRLSDAHPLAVSVRERRLVEVATRAQADAEFPLLRSLPDRTHESALAVPVLLGEHNSSGGLLISWTGRRELDGSVRAVAGDLARQVGHAVDRALLAAARARLQRSLTATSTTESVVA